MRFLFFILLFTSLRISFSQCDSMHFQELGTEPAHCRTMSYQTGNGVVYAYAVGTGPTTHQWTNLATGQTTNNTTWGGLNPGLYKIIATDSIGCIISEVVKLDSVNPNANFELESINVDTTFFGYYSAEIILTNTSDDILNVAWPDPFDEPYYFWKTETDTDWTAKHFWETYSATVDSPGFHEICLVAVNKNFCTDTLCQSITISPAVFEEDSVNVYYSSVTGEVSIELLLSEEVIFNLVEINGGISFQYLLQPDINTFQLDSGIYAYEIINSQSTEIICTGTIAIF